MIKRFFIIFFSIALINSVSILVLLNTAPSARVNNEGIITKILFVIVLDFLIFAFAFIFYFAIYFIVKYIKNGKI